MRFKALENRSTMEPAPLTPLASAKTKTFFGTTPRMQEIHSLISHVGWSEAPVLIQGETGSGKEMLARELHSQFSAAGKVFLKLNCAALPSELVESELFGYERGAFTGAFQKKIGMFEAADGGTILLDEIGDMDVRLQAKLLQVLQDREFQRIGGKEVIKVDVRVMAATHRDLEKAMVDRTFREDLYYRLNVITIELPPLRERKEDIIPLAEYLAKKHAVPGRRGFADAGFETRNDDVPLAGKCAGTGERDAQADRSARSRLIARELQCKRSASRAHRSQPQPSALPRPRSASTPEFGNAPILEQVTKAKQQAEMEAILAALNSTRWNRKQAAALLKIDYKALLYKMKKLGVDDQAAPLKGSPVTPPVILTATGD